MKNFLKSENIEFYALIPLKKCKIIKNYLLEKNGFSENDNALVMLFPYRSENLPVNISVYSSCPDYHKFVSEFGARVENFIKTKYPYAKFKVFSDHSPIDEVHACCISGLGLMGDNGLLINEKYSSFVFLGECITDLSPEELGIEYSDCAEIKTCLHCGACKKSCPSQCIGSDLPKQKECLSAITQKKGSLLPEEIEMIIKSGCIWGCDICQNVCPYSKKASFSPIEFFKNDVISMLDKKTLDSLTDEEFLSRAFSWRGRETIERNVEIYEKYIKNKGGIKW